MKFVTYENPIGEIKVGVLSGNQIIDLDYSDMKDFLTEGGIFKVENKPLENYKVYKIHQIKLKAPVINPSKIVCLGLNYIDHAKELKMSIPDEPIIFLKPPTAVIGPEEPIVYPKVSTRVDYEVELGIIISERTKKVSKLEAKEFIAGFTVFNDVTARDLQQKDIQWTRAKSFDTFAPVGPSLVSKSEINSSNLELQLRVNNQVKQKSNTKNMIFSIEYLVEFISNIMTLEPGDIIATGTPPGVGPFKPGDIIEAEIEKIGILRNPVISER